MGEESCIWIGGLPEWGEEDDIRNEFKKYGSIKHVTVRKKQGHYSFAFCQYSEKSDAEDAVKEMDQAKLYGMQFVKVAWAGKKASKGGGKQRRRSPSQRRRSPSPPRE